MKEHKKSKASGITLIALVVTIIVLLLLVGISIMMLSGNNGILQRAGEAKEETKKEAAREQIKLEILATLDNDGKLNLQNLTANLEKINTDVTDINNTELTEDENAKTGRITLNEYNFYIDNNNNVKDYKGPLKSIKPEVSDNNSFNRAYGRIDIIYLNETGYNITETPNKPNIDKTMVPVYYDDINKVWKVCSEEDTETWYNYEPEDVEKAGTSEGDTHKNRWANVMLTDLIQVEKEGTTYTTEQIKTLLTENNLNQIVGATVTKEGSMLVWIPRYAYRITYYQEAEKNTVIGYSDSRGFVDTDGKTPKDMQTPTTSININGKIGTTSYEYYRPHPAFETDLDQGGWSSRISGIWVGKFEATGTTNEVTTVSTTNSIPIKYTTNGVLWESLKNNFKAKTTDSHMIKNSECGAYIYLSESKFGRNEVPVTANNNSNCYTGDGNYKENQNQSTTGNIYGIYDTVGKVDEYVAGYIPNEKVTNGNQFASIDGTNNNKTESTKFSTVYKYDNTNDVDGFNYRLALNKVFGDAICEVSTSGSWYMSWREGASLFVGSSKYTGSSLPFFCRSGYSEFCGFSCSSGTKQNFTGTRVVCIVK